MPVPVDREDASQLLPWQYSKPGQLRQEYLVDDTLKMASVPAGEIMKLRPPVPQNLMPPRLGYRSEPLTIRDVLNTDRWAPQQRSWVSGARQMQFIDEDAHMSAGLRNFIGGTHQ